MARKPKKSLPEPGSVRAKGRYGSEALSGIVEAGGLPADVDRGALGRALDAAVVEYSAFRRHDQNPAPFEARRMFRRIESASVRFLDALEALATRSEREKRNKVPLSLLLGAGAYRPETAAPLFTGMRRAEFLRCRRRELASLDDLRAVREWGFVPEAILAEAALKVRQVRDGAALAAEREGSKVGAKGKAAHRGDRAVRGFVWGLASIYEEFTGRRAGVSRTPDSGRAGGPAVRFIVACLTPPLRNRGERIPTAEQVREFLRRRRRRAESRRGESASRIS